MKLKIDETVHLADLSLHKKYVDWSPGAQYFTLGAGQEHYKLLAALSAQLPLGSQVVDCGTLYGCSAVALSVNPGVTVHTFDLEDRLTGQGERVKQIHNIFFHQQCCIASVTDMLDGVQPLIIVLDIDPHDGEQEADFVSKLMMFNYRGLLICDDIHLNEAMKKFWRYLEKLATPTQTHSEMKWRVLDVTEYGHWSGTGIVVFDPETIDVEVEAS